MSCRAGDVLYTYKMIQHLGNSYLSSLFHSSLREFLPFAPLLFRSARPPGSRLSVGAKVLGKEEWKGDPSG